MATIGTPRAEALRGHLAMLGFSALVAGSFSLGAMAAPFVDPAALTTLRFAVAGAIVGAAALATTGISRSAFVAPWRYLVLGALLALYFVMMFEGLKTAAPVSASAVFTLTPLMAAGFGWLLLRQITTARMALALAIGAAGAAWVIFRADWHALMDMQIGKGEVIYFWGCAAHALYAPMVRKLNRGEPAIVFSFGMMVAGTVLLALWSWPAIMATDWRAMPAIVWITLAYVSVAASAITFVLLQYAAMRLPSAKVMAYTYLTPTWVILWEIALGRGVPPLGILAGIAMTILALYLLLED
ncbi:DMT family transporter (plasmid) [Pseudorhodobacter turbinis]|uniref:DMT family transporter n=1 Tax=Pseudorhodobacter turbinis TaxID=2500533 RepID=A0A4P8EHT9_9RHOB|nr:DMT family transporter [Pseudorhodobacter turbinis]QCO56730.1 DMT family transporter [Pseudorhodobacter turbinis]